MTTMRIPSYFRSLNINSLKCGQALSADKAILLAGNSGWLYEAYMDQPVNDNSAKSIQKSYNHTGRGTGKHIPIIMNQMRGLLRSNSDFTQPFRLTGDGTVQEVNFISSSVNTGNIDTSETGFNWSKFNNVSFWPHIYANILRTRFKARLYSGTQSAKIWPVIYEDEFNDAVILTGDNTTIDSTSYSSIDIEIDLNDALLERSSFPDSPWFWGLKIWIPSGSVVDLYDDDYTGPCLAICSI